jgi:hypothetical protein
MLRSVPGWEVFVGPRRGTVRTDGEMLGLSADYSLEEVSEPNVVLDPGSEETPPLMARSASSPGCARPSPT